MKRPQKRPARFICPVNQAPESLILGLLLSGEEKRRTQGADRDVDPAADTHDWNRISDQATAKGKGRELQAGGSGEQGDKLPTLDRLCHLDI
jgi:hypothetical protein